MDRTNRRNELLLNISSSNLEGRLSSTGRSLIPQTMLKRNEMLTTRNQNYIVPKHQQMMPIHNYTDLNAMKLETISNQLGIVRKHQIMPKVGLNRSVPYVESHKSSAFNGSITFSNKDSGEGSNIKKKLIVNDANPIKTKNESTSNIFGNSSLERMSFYTGTIERVIKWHSIVKDKLCLYEVIAPVVSIQEGSIAQQKIMILRDKKGPILQVQYYPTIHLNIDNFHVGQSLRCVGRMIGFNIMSAQTIRDACPDEIATLQRFSYVCDYAISHCMS